MTVLVVGEALIDVVHHLDGSVEEHAGGSPFNVAIGLARLGVSTELAAQFGPDEHGGLLIGALERSGVGRSLVDASERTSTAIATMDAAGNATYEFDLTWAPAELPDPTRYEAIHVGSLGTFVEPGASRVAELVLSADALGVPVSFDPNVRPTIDPDGDAWVSAFRRVETHARIVKMSDADAELLFPGTDPEQVVRDLARAGHLAVVTRGGEGAVAAVGSSLVSVEPGPIEVVDTIGAGDSFMAAMLAWHATYDWPAPNELDEAELHDLLSYAAKAAAITCSRPGADPPWLEDL